jgi:hypothetical protein
MQENSEGQQQETKVIPINVSGETLTGKRSEIKKILRERVADIAEHQMKTVRARSEDQSVNHGEVNTNQREGKRSSSTSMRSQDEENQPGFINQTMQIESINELKPTESDIMDVFSPERINKFAEEYGFIPGTSVDLETGWDLRLRMDRLQLMELMDRDQPTLVVGSPRCTMFTLLQNLNWGKWPSATKGWPDDTAKQ